MRVLVVAPHADDEALGVGGTIARYAAEGHDVVVAIMTGYGPERNWPGITQAMINDIRAEAKQAHAILGVRETIFRDIPTVIVEAEPLWKINEIAGDVLKEIAPDVLYVPFSYDLHRDHRAISHSFEVAYRPSSAVGRRIKEVYMYETVSETHWAPAYIDTNYSPNVWVDIQAYLPKKLDALRCFKSQMRPAPDARSLEAVEALATWRGSQMSMHAAEAFLLVRRTW
jgi:LmbE family N-acetylglucosaminyl deacetylase